MNELVPHEDPDSHFLPAPVRPASSVEDLLRLAVERGATVETIERLMAVRRELNAEQSRNAFFAALSAFQAECPAIRKTKLVMNKDGRTVRYAYAPLESIVEQTKAILKKHGFSYTLDSAMEADAVIAVCLVHHIGGHSERFTFRAPTATDAFMSAPQKVGAAMTFASRYVYRNAFGIMTGDDDTDAAKDEEAESPKTPQPPQERPTPWRKAHSVPQSPPTPPSASQTASRPASVAPAEVKAARAALEAHLVKCKSRLIALMAQQGQAADDYAKVAKLILPPAETLADANVQHLFPSVDWTKTVEQNEAAIVADKDRHLKALEAFMSGEAVPEVAHEAEEPPIVISQKPDLAGCQQTQGVVENVSVREGEGKNGKPPWRRVGICLEGVWYSTFHRNLGDTAYALKGKEVIAWFNAAKLGNDLIWVEPIEQLLGPEFEEVTP